MGICVIFAYSLMMVGCHEDITEEQSEIEISSNDNVENAVSEYQEEQLEPEILNFRDVFGEEYQVEINEKIAKNPYDNALFQHKEEKLYYNDSDYDCRLGVDVSHHQGYIDWQKVKAEGYDFTFLRIGYRGYGKEGNINADTEFDRNIQNAKNAGLDVGVYFFAQAINEEEAKEEADFVIKKLQSYSLELPVVYDPESILDATARTDDVSGEQFTKNAAAFCKTIKKAGYEPMIYSNMLWEAYKLDLEQLSDYPVWYADYELVPQTPYDFTFWQYTNEGSVNGISGNTDLNIWMKK